MYLEEKKSVTDNRDVVKNIIKIPTDMTFCTFLCDVTLYSETSFAITIGMERIAICNAMSRILFNIVSTPNSLGPRNLARIPERKTPTNLRTSVLMRISVLPLNNLLPYSDNISRYLKIGY